MTSQWKWFPNRVHGSAEKLTRSEVEHIEALEVIDESYIKNARIKVDAHKNHETPLLSELSKSQQQRIRKFRSTRENELKAIKEKNAESKDQYGRMISPYWDEETRNNTEDLFSDESDFPSLEITPLNETEQLMLEWRVGGAYSVYLAKKKIIEQIEQLGGRYFDGETDGFSFEKMYDDWIFEADADGIPKNLETLYRGGIASVDYEWAKESAEEMWTRFGASYKSRGKTKEDLLNERISFQESNIGKERGDTLGHIGIYDSISKPDNSKNFFEYFSKYPWFDPEIETQITELTMPTWWTPQHQDRSVKENAIYGNLLSSPFWGDTTLENFAQEMREVCGDHESAKEELEELHREQVGDEYYERFKESRDESGKEFINPELRQDVLQRDKFTCQHCGRSAPDVVLHIDHVIPESKGGPTELDNLQVLCEECNIGKGNRYNN